MIEISEATARAALVLLIGANSEQVEGKRLIADSQEELQTALAKLDAAKPAVPPNRAQRRAARKG